MIEETKKEDIVEQPQTVEMTIILFNTGAIQVKFPLLNNKLAAYGLLKMAEKTLDQHYKKLDESLIKPADGGIMDFARKIFKGKR